MKKLNQAETLFLIELINPLLPDSNDDEWRRLDKIIIKLRDGQK